MQKWAYLLVYMEIARTMEIGFMFGRFCFLQVVHINVTYYSVGAHRSTSIEKSRSRSQFIIHQNNMMKTIIISNIRMSLFNTHTITCTFVQRASFQISRESLSQLVMIRWEEMHKTSIWESICETLKFSRSSRHAFQSGDDASASVWSNSLASANTGSNMV